MDSPLNEQIGLPPPTFRRPALIDPVQQRMVMILGFVALVVITAVSFIPRLITGDPANEAALETAVLPANAAAQTGAEETGALAAIGGFGNSISPIFSAPVKYWEPQIVAWANQFGLDPDIVATIMQIESCGDPQVTSPAGARGLFQVMPMHFAVGEDMHDPDTNAMRGLSFFNEQLRYTGGDTFLSLAGYNGGYAASGSSFENWADETQRYYVWAKGLYEDAKAGNSTSSTLDRWLSAGGASLCQGAAQRLGLN